jgi:hypothetical protein
LAEGKILGVVEKLGKDSFSPVRFRDKYRADPPDLIVLVGEKHGSNGLSPYFLD